jgi:mannan endo-1,4-beta-mannosidase
MRPRPLAAVIGLLLLLLAVPWHAAAASDDDGGMVRVDGTRFVVGDGDRTLYLSGFNAYWLMEMASDPSQRGKVVAAFRQASAHGLNLARTWAFSDGGDRPLQSSPGVYHEDMFQVTTGRRR